MCIYLIISLERTRCIPSDGLKYLLGLQENTSTDKKCIEAYGINRYLLFFEKYLERDKNIFHLCQHGDYLESMRSSFYYY